MGCTNRGTSVLGRDDTRLSEALKMPDGSALIVRGDRDGGARRLAHVRMFSGREAPTSQLFLAPVVVSEAGAKANPALYFWNQPIDESNHTPAWDTFNIPPPPPPPPPPPK